MALTKRITFYYQTFDTPLVLPPHVTHLHLAALHFGTEVDGQPYIHLNNYYPDSPVFDDVWDSLQALEGIRILIMIGGAGGGFAAFFSNYDIYYPMLVQFLHNHNCISGVDLDIEETVDIGNIRLLISDIKRDFPSFLVAMAPLQTSLQQDVPGLGGFIYKDLYMTPEGSQIDYFNTQFYTDFSIDAYNQIINNGYPANKVVMGSINGSGDAVTVQTLVRTYPTFGGVFSWEYDTTPVGWVASMYSSMNNPGSAILWYISKCICLGGSRTPLTPLFTIHGVMGRGWPPSPGPT